MQNIESIPSALDINQFVSGSNITGCSEDSMAIISA